MDSATGYDSMIWHLVNRCLKLKRFQEKTTRTKEDLFQEAQVAATLAVASYSAAKGASLKTFVYSCVRNRLADIIRREVASPELLLTEDAVVLADATLEGTAYNSIEDIEFDLTMKALLSKLEYRVYFMSFVEDKSEREISSELGIHRRRVHSCLQAIFAKFRSLEESRDRILTQIELQKKWLELSPA